MTQTCFIICGAVAHEVLAIVKRHEWDADVIGVAAMNHVFPDRIAPDVEARIEQLRDKYKRLIVVYGDCGSRGELDRVLMRHNVERVQGPHCYEWYGGEKFQSFMDEEPGTFFLTDFMVRGFKGTILKGMGLDRFPELRQEYFKHYQRIVYLVQKPDFRLLEQAKAVADYLRLPLEVRATGYNKLESRLVEMMQPGYRPKAPREVAEVAYL